MGCYSMRNKYTNKALKQGNRHYNNYQGTTGYIQVKKQINIFTLLKYLFIIVTCAIIAFYSLTK